MLIYALKLWIKLIVPNFPLPRTEIIETKIYKIEQSGPKKKKEEAKFKHLDTITQDRHKLQL